MTPTSGALDAVPVPGMVTLDPALLKAHVDSGKETIFRLTKRGNFGEVGAFFASPAREATVRVSLSSWHCRSHARSRHVPST
jgi:hypothetical protein